MKLTDEEAEALYDYFLKRAGYISFEHDLVVHNIIKKLEVYLYNLEEEKQKEDD
jgi:hypothetical protein